MGLLPKINAVKFDPKVLPWPEVIIPWPHKGYQPRDCSWGFVVCGDEKVHVMAGDYVIYCFDNAYFCKKEKYKQFVEKWNAKYKKGLMTICEAIIASKKVCK